MYSAHCEEVCRVGAERVGTLPRPFPFAHLRLIDYPEVESIPLYEEELVLVVDSRHRFVKHDSIDLKELGQEQLILFDRASSNYELTKSLLRGTGVQPRVIELDNIEAAKRMVEHRLGVAFLPQQAVVRAVKAGRLCVIGVNEGPNLKRSIAALRRIDLPLTGAAEAFLRIVIKASKSLC
jgi:DNA-binding transcriptional LysR family regulator